MARKLELTRARVYSRWNDKEIVLFRENYPTLSNRDLRNQFFPNRSLDSIKHLARKLKLVKPKQVTLLARGASLKASWNNNTSRKENLRVLLKKRWKDPRFRENISKAVAANWKDPEKRHNMRVTVRNLWKDPTHREKMKSVSERRWRDANAHLQASDRFKKLWKSPGHRQHISESMKNTWKDPEHRSKIPTWKDNWNDPVTGKKMRETHRAAMQRSEVKEKISKKSRALWKKVSHRKKVMPVLKKSWEDPERKKLVSRVMIEKWKDPIYLEQMRIREEKEKPTKYLRGLKSIESRRKKGPYHWKKVPFTNKEEIEVAKLLLDEPNYRKNCFIKIGKLEIDFFPKGKVFVEYHPWDHSKRSTEEYISKREAAIKESEYRGTPLIVISDSVTKKNKRVLAIIEELKRQYDL